MDMAAKVDTGNLFGSSLSLAAAGLADLPKDVLVPGVAVFSRRALPLAAWTNGLEIAGEVGASSCLQCGEDLPGVGFTPSASSSQSPAAKRGALEGQSNQSNRTVCSLTHTLCSLQVSPVLGGPDMNGAAGTATQCYHLPDACITLLASHHITPCCTAGVKADVERSCLILETGVNQRWRYGGWRPSPDSVEEAEGWEEAKQGIK
jgi:hypothetical protein